MARRQPIALKWQKVSTAWLPFADVATKELPLSRILRLSLFQVSVGMAAVLLTGTLNRVMIVELSLAAWLVGLMVAIPLVFAPLRALIGHKSDNHTSVLGWRRVPYIWFGSLLQFGGLAIMPFALLVMTGTGTGNPIIGEIGAAVAFLMVGAGMHTTQTAGLALATDLATEENRPRVVALLYVMLLVGMLISAIVLGTALRDFTNTGLIQVIQGTAVLTMTLNIIALWKQEARNPSQTRADIVRPTFKQSWAEFIQHRRTRRLLVAVGLGAAGFGMQDVLLEPYGGQVLGMSVGATTALTSLWATGALIGFSMAARQLARGGDAGRLAASGGLLGVVAFSLVIMSAPVQSTPLLGAGVVLIGLGGGLFSVGTLIAAMDLSRTSDSGLALGAWGAVQATCGGVGIALGGFLRDLFAALASNGTLGTAMSDPSVGYSVVWHLEILLLFGMLAALGPLVRRSGAPSSTAQTPAKFGLTEFPT